MTLNNKTRLCSESVNLRQGIKPQSKVIHDSNTGFLMNPDSDPDVCWIGPKISWIHYVVGSSHVPIPRW